MLKALVAMRLLDNKRVVQISVFLFVALMVWLIFVEVENDPRMADGSLSIEQMYWWEYPLVLSPFAILVLWFSCLMDTVRTRNVKWTFLILFFFPTVLIYLFVRRRYNATNKETKSRTNSSALV